MFDPEEFAMSDEEMENATGLMVGIIGSVMQVGLTALNDDHKYRDYFYDHVPGMDDELFAEVVEPVTNLMIQNFLAINHSEEGTKEMANLVKMFGNAIDGNES